MAGGFGDFKINSSGASSIIPNRLASPDATITSCIGEN